MSFAICMKVRGPSSMRKTDFEDDGRTIVDMSGVERPNLLTFRLSRKKTERLRRDTEPADGQSQSTIADLDKKQSRSVIFGTVLAGLVIAGIFIACGALVIYLLTVVWN